MVLRQGEIEGDSIAPAAEACGGDSNGQNYELTDAESSSSASEVQVCMDTEYFLGIRYIYY